MMHTCRNNRLSLRRRSLIALCGALALASPAAQAAKVKVQGEGTISSSDFPSQIAIGDEYSFEFIYDDTTLATPGLPSCPQCPGVGETAEYNAFESFSFQVGQYIWTLSEPISPYAVIEVTNDEPQTGPSGRIDALHFSFYDLSGPDFVEGPVRAGLQIYMHSDVLRDTSLRGMTIATAPDQGQIGAFFGLVGNNGSIGGDFPSITVAPEATEWLFMSAGLVGVMAALRRKRRLTRSLR